MKKRILISEEEKNRILGLHKSKLIIEQGDYKMDKQEKEIAKLDSLANDPSYILSTKKSVEKTLKPGLYYFSVKGCGSCEKYSANVWPDIEKTFVDSGVNIQKIVFDDFEGDDIESIRKTLGKLGAKDVLTYFPQVKIIDRDDKVAYENAYPYVDELVKEVNKIFDKKIEFKKEEKKGENIVTNFDRKYNYKKEGDKYFYQLKSTPDKWTEATDASAKSAIAVQVFKDKSGCVFPNKVDACPDYNGEKWDENPENKKVDFDKTKIGFCSTNYCTVKYIQDTLNAIIKDPTKKGHEKLKGMTPLTKDGKFGSSTQTYIYKLLGKVAATTKEIENEWKTK